MLDYKGITSHLIFSTDSILFIQKTIDAIYDFFEIKDIFPKFEIIIHPEYQKDQSTPPEVRNGFIMLCTDLCDGRYAYYQQITWQFSHELVHVCKGHIESRKNWKSFPDDDDEEILAGGISIWIIKNLCPTYDYKEKYSKTNLDQCEEKAESLKYLLHIK